MTTTYRFLVLQTILATGLFAMWLAGYLEKPFIGESKWFCWFVVGVAIYGLGSILFNKMSDASWIAEKLVRIAVVGMQVGILVALANVSSAILSGGDLTKVAALFLGSVGVSFYVSLTALASNLWLEFTLRMLGYED